MGQRDIQSGKKDAGNIADIMVTGIFILSMAVVMLSFLENINMVRQKAEVDQLARQYILRMETVGGLLQEDRDKLQEALLLQGVTEIDLSGTTFGEAGYGEKITLQIKGLLGGKYEFEETRESTAKH